MNKNSEGFIFFMTLCVICVLSILLMSAMQEVLLYHQALNRQEQMHQQFYQLEGVATKLAREYPIFSKKTCNTLSTESQSLSANTVIELLVHNKGCSFSENQGHYRYLIEDMGVFPCLVIKQDSHAYASRHFRISLLFLVEKTHSAALLQIRVLKADLEQHCEGKPHSVASGISSWRYLNDVG